MTTSSLQAGNFSLLTQIDSPDQSPRRCATPSCKSSFFSTWAIGWHPATTPYRIRSQSTKFVCRFIISSGITANYLSVVVSDQYSGLVLNFLDQAARDRDQIALKLRSSLSY